MEFDGLKHESSNRTPRGPLIAVFAIVAFHLILASIWIQIDETPPYWDEAWYLYQGAVQYEALRDGSLADWYAAWTDLDLTRPSLVPTLTVVPFALFGVSNDTGLLVNLGALVVLLVATCALGTSIAGWRAGLLSACLVGSYPLLIGLNHILMVELTMVALVVGTLYALWRADGFRHRGWSITAGVLVGCGMLTKVFFFVFVAGPWFVVALQAARHNRLRPARHQVVNAFISLLVPIIMGSFWYLPNFGTMLGRQVAASIGTEAAPYGPSHPWQWQNLRNYFLGFVGTNTSFAGFLIFVVGCVGLAVTERKRQRKNVAFQSSDRYAILFLGSSILLAYALFTSLRNQDLKHIAGVLPSVAVLSGWGVTSLFRRRWWWALVAVIILLISLLQVVVGTLPGWFQNYQLKVPVGDSDLWLIYPAQPPILNTRYAAPEPRSWPLHELLSYALYVADLEGLPRDQARVAVIPNHPVIEEHALRFQAFREHMPVVIATALVSNLPNQDVLIHKTGDWGFAPSHPAIRQVLAALAQADSDFERMPRTFSLPDGSEALIYVRRPTPLLSEVPSPEFPMQITYGDSARFLGFDLLASNDLEADPSVTITYYWESLAATPKDLRAFVHLLDPRTDDILLQDDHPLFPRVYPSTMWQPDRYLVERRTVTTPSAFSGSALKLRLGLYSEDGRVPVTAHQGKLSEGNDHADVGLIPVYR